MSLTRGNVFLSSGILEDNSNLFLNGVNDQYVHMNFIYGIDGIDRDSNPNGKKFNQFMPSDNRGSAVYNKNFDITNSDTQQDILDACKLLRDKVCTAKACSGGKLIRPEGVTCFLEEFDTWLQATHSETRSTTANVLSRIKTFRSSTKPASEPITGSWEEIIGLVDGEIKYVNIPTFSSMLTLRPFKEKQEVRDVVDAVVKELSSTGHPTTGKVITEAGIAWTWMTTEKGLVDGLFLGFSI